MDLNRNFKNTTWSGKQLYMCCFFVYHCFSICSIHIWTYCNTLTSSLGNSKITFPIWKTKRQEWLCMRVQPTEREIYGSGLFEWKGRISFHNHRLNLSFCSVHFEKDILLELSIRHSVGNLNPVLCLANGEERSHLQNGIQRDNFTWRRRSGKTLGSYGFFLCYTFSFSCTRCLIF